MRSSRFCTCFSSSRVSARSLRSCSMNRNASMPLCRLNGRRLGTFGFSMARNVWCGLLSVSDVCGQWLEVHAAGARERPKAKSAMSERGLHQNSRRHTHRHTHRTPPSIRGRWKERTCAEVTS